MRINKYLAQSGFCSRRKADTLIEDGKVLINGKRAKLGDEVNEDAVVQVGNQKIVNKENKIYIAFNKPIGVISTSDKNANNTIYDYVDVPERIFYLGRLDVASSGLMLLTNDGALANTISHGSGDTEKEYIVAVDKPLTRRALESWRNGIVILGRKTKPAHVKKVTDTKFKITITEGRNRQIRRMCEKLGYGVVSLKRIRVGNVKLGDLGPGNWRQLTKNERRGLTE
ncbi:rRNA pseudouridine synthase [Patescibacteria group bacterium]|nr:rRNA pseudouridine synthase [Patescibacteria group bacterium]